MRTVQSHQKPKPLWQNKRPAFRRGQPMLSKCQKPVMRPTDYSVSYLIHPQLAYRCGEVNLVPDTEHPSHWTSDPWQRGRALAQPHFWQICPPWVTFQCLAVQTLVSSIHRMQCTRRKHSQGWAQGKRQWLLWAAAHGCASPQSICAW